MRAFKYTKTELRIIEFVRRRTAENDSIDEDEDGVAIEEIIDEIYKDKVIPRHPRASIAAVIRNLKIKMIANKDKPIERVSELGYARKARYKI